MLLFQLHKMFLFTGKPFETSDHNTERCSIQPSASHPRIHVCGGSERFTGAIAGIPQDCWQTEGEGVGRSSAGHQAGRLDWHGCDIWLHETTQPHLLLLILMYSLLLRWEGFVVSDGSLEFI